MRKWIVSTYLILVPPLFFVDVNSETGPSATNGLSEFNRYMGEAHSQVWNDAVLGLSNSEDGPSLILRQTQDLNQIILDDPEARVLYDRAFGRIGSNAMEMSGSGLDDVLVAINPDGGGWTSHDSPGKLVYDPVLNLYVSSQQIAPEEPPQGSVQYFPTINSVNSGSTSYEELPNPIFTPFEPSTTRKSCDHYLKGLRTVEPIRTVVEDDGLSEIRVYSFGGVISKQTAELVCNDKENVGVYEDEIHVRYVYHG